MARSSEMKVEWLVDILQKKTLTRGEIAPYIHLLLTEYQYSQRPDGVDSSHQHNEYLTDIFVNLPRSTILEILSCADVYDIPVLLEIIKQIEVDEAILILKKTPPSYEKRPTQVFDQVFMAIHNCDDHLLTQAKLKMQHANEMPEYFNSVYERFQQILKDKEILSSIYPNAALTIS